MSSRDAAQLTAKLGVLRFGQSYDDRLIDVTGWVAQHLEEVGTHGGCEPQTQQHRPALQVVDPEESAGLAVRLEDCPHLVGDHHGVGREVEELAPPLAFSLQLLLPGGEGFGLPSELLGRGP